MNDTSSKYGSPFCESTVQKYHGTCSASTFAVPDYRGYFLRVAGMWRSGDSTSWNANFTSNKQSGRVTSINTQQNEQLPNITERFSGVGQYYSSGTDIKNVVGGAFYRWNTANAPDEGAKVANNDGQRDDIFGFEASRSNSIYSGSHVIPANYSVYAYIYAGRVVK